MTVFLQPLLLFLGQGAYSSCVSWWEGFCCSLSTTSTFLALCWMLVWLLHSYFINVSVLQVYPQISCSFAFITADKNPSSDPLLITSVDDLLAALPPIANPPVLCQCLEMSTSDCYKISSDYQRRHVQKVVREWHSQSQNPSWEKVVDALFCVQNDHHAKQLAEKKGVKWKPLQSKWKKNTDASNH